MNSKTLAVLFALGLLSGCVTGRPLREIAVDSNRLVERTANEQSLLNILRAKDRMPLHFTAFSALRGSLSISGTAGVNMDLPEGSKSRVFDGSGAPLSTTLADGIDVIKPSLGVSMNSSPSFDLAVLDTQEFQRGILTPVRPETVEYFLRQGWPEDLITALFISRVEIRTENKTVVIPNHPTDRTHQIIDVDANTHTRHTTFGFQDFIDQTVFIPFETQSNATPVIGLKEIGSGLDLNEIKGLESDNLEIVGFKPTPNQPYVASKKKTSKTARFFVVRREAFSEVLHEVGVESSKVRMCSIKTDSGDIVMRLSSNDGVCNDDGPAPEVRYVFRSPEGIIYFLGSYVRYDIANESDKQVYTIEGGKRVISIELGKHRDALITADYRGKKYSLVHPGIDPSHRGSQAIVLVQQLINLQKKAEKLPTTATVRVSP